MSSEEYMSSSEEDAFSDNCSEDDWQPNQASSEDSESEQLQTGSSPSPDKKRTKITTAKRASKKCAAVEKQKPTRTGKVMSGSILELLERAKAGKRDKLNLSSEAGPSTVKAIKVVPLSPKKQPTAASNNKPATNKVADHDDEESSSSGDEYLVPPEKLDLGSSFFEPKSNTSAGRIPTPNFDCNVGIGNLSSESDQDDSIRDDGHSTNIMDNLKNFAQNMDEAKVNLKNYEEKKNLPSTDTPMDVSSLLALGEAKDKEEAPIAQVVVAGKKRVQRDEDSADSDWEEVEDAEQNDSSAPDQSVPDNVQVLLGVPTDRRRAKLQNDFEVAVKRQLNKQKREQQVLLHQSGFKDWLEQGNYINGILNNTQLYQITLKLLPSAQAYPKDKTDMKYFEQLTKWYRGAIKLASSEMYPPLVDDLDMMSSLRKEVEGKAANSKRDYVLIYIILLRAIGIQCRMVINVVVPPIRPPQSELCRITSKPKEEASMKKEKGKGKRKVRKNEEEEESEKGDDDDDYDEIAEQLSIKKKSSSASSRATASTSRTRSIMTEGDKPEKSKKSSRKMEDEVKSSSKDRSKTSKSSRSSNGQSSRSKDAIDKESNKKDSSASDKEEKPLHRTRSTRTTNKSDSSTSLKVEDLAEGTSSKPKSTRSRTTSKKSAASKELSIPQVDGMDDLPTPISKRTRSRSKTPIPVEVLSVKRTIISKKSTDSPIKPRRGGNNQTNTLQVPKKESSSDLFAVDPTEKKTVTKSRKSPSRETLKRQAVEVKEDPEAPIKKSQRIAEVMEIDRRVLSTDEEDTATTPAKVKPTDKTDFWPEVWLEKEEKWICVDLFKGKVDSCDTVTRAATVPIAYALGWNNDSTVKDVSLRYCPQWHSVNKKMRTEQAFVDGALAQLTGKYLERDKKEDEELNRIAMDRPMPTTISDFKNHPQYALERHLLKFEAIYPPNPLTLGFVRGEAVYARECVHTLHSRELWVKQARVVKPGETPYKIVTARPKWERATNTVIKDLPLELFGTWQTMPYEPPVAENGIVPKNAYGNVELFKECMLPINTVHLPYPNLGKVCKRLKIDYAPAVVGFDFHSGYSHPVYEGFVVCQEFAEIVTDAWIRDTEEAQKREEEKRQERIYGNWKRLIKGLMIKKRLQSKYNFEDKD